MLLGIALLFAQDGAALLNDGARVTNSQTVQLRVRFGSPMPPGTEMSIADGAWKPFVESQPLELPAGDGAKEVAVKLRDAAGKELGVYKASIVLDTTPPEARVKVADGTATLISEVPDAVAMQWTEDAAKWGAWMPYITPRDVEVSEPKTILVRYRDEAGNVSKPATVRVALTMPTESKVAITSEPAITLRMTWAGMTEMVVQVDDEKPQPREPFASMRPLNIANRNVAHRVRLSLFDAAGAETKVEIAFQEQDLPKPAAESNQEAAVEGPKPWALSVQGGLLPSAIEFEAIAPSGLRRINKDALGLVRVSLAYDVVDPLYVQVGLEYAGGGGIRVYSGSLDVGARLFTVGSVTVAAEAGLIYSDLSTTESSFGDFDAAIGFRGGVRVSVALTPRASLDATIDYRKISYDYADPVVSGDREARLSTVGLLLGASLRF